MSFPCLEVKPDERLRFTGRPMAPKGFPMRTLRLLVIASVFTPVVGCNWMKEWRENGDQNRQRGGLENKDAFTAETAVRYLNSQAALLQSIEYDDVHVRVYEKGFPAPVVDGNLACAQPRYFRMHVGKMTSDVDLGSNLDQFWVYMKVPGERPMYVYASHTDYAEGRAKLPGGLPFDPDWVMQSFGMIHFDPAAPYEMAYSERERAYTLSWPATAPGGMAVTKQIVFESGTATGTRPRVKKHIVRDPKTKNIITSAEVKSVQTLSITDMEGRAVAVQYPTRIALRWESQKFEMDMLLDKARLNQQLVNDPQRRQLFTMPRIDIPGEKGPINLAGGMPMKVIR